MKKIEAIIKPFRLDDVCEGLIEHGIKGLTITEVRGFGTQLGRVDEQPGQDIFFEFHPKVKIELVVADDAVDALVEIIKQRANSGRIGDGKIFISSVEEAIRIRTGDTGKAAIV